MCIRPELRFEDVQGDLIYSATKRKWKNLDSMLDAEAYRIYTSSRCLNQRPDTLKVTAILTPVNKHSNNSVETEISIDSTYNKDPNGSRKGIIILSSLLPIDIQVTLLNLY